MHKELKERINDLLMFAVSGNAADLSDYMRDRQKETAKIIKKSLTPPTADEIITISNEYFKSIHWQNTVEWYESNKEFTIVANNKHYGHISTRQTRDLELFPSKIQNMYTSFFMSLEANNGS